jgi:hypothetical protein
MGDQGLAEIELSAFIRVLVLGPLTAARSGTRLILHHGTVVAVTDAVLDDIVILAH